MKEEIGSDVLREDTIAHTAAQMKGRRLRMVRALTGFSRQELYEQVGIATSTMDTWESGRVELTPKSANRVCEAFERVGISCSPDWLLSGTGALPRMMNDVEKSVFLTQKIEEPALMRRAVNVFPPFLDDDIRRELSFFLSLHKDALFHFIEGDFMNARFKRGDCVAGEVDKLSCLEGKIIIAMLNGGGTIACKLVKNREKYSEISFGMNMPLQRVQIVKGAAIVWHRMFNNKKN